MRLDLRLPIGLMFTIVGAMLAVFGLMSDEAIYARSLGINVNLWWGLVLLAFGVVMLGFAIRASRRLPPPRPPDLNTSAFRR
jgi:ABC-type Fe3+-siderophore transport system permease subunit